MPKSSTPALLLTTVRSFVPLRRTAPMRFSGMPQSPKPPIRMVMPSRRLATAASADATRLSMRASLVEFTADAGIAEIAVEFKGCAEACRVRWRHRSRLRVHGNRGARADRRCGGQTDRARQREPRDWAAQYRARVDKGCRA